MSSLLASIPQLERYIQHREEGQGRGGEAKRGEGKGMEGKGREEKERERSTLTLLD